LPKTCIVIYRLQPVIVSVYFTLEIQTKDGKYKYDFNNFSCKSYYGIEYNLLSNSYIKNGVWQKKLDQDWLEIKQDVNARMVNMIVDLKKSMNAPSDNW
jgi:hypothetical protein